MLAKFAKPHACQDCALHEMGKGFAPPSGPPNAKLLFVGEALGYNEAMQGVPFVGAAGGMFERILRRAEISRDTSKVHNCVSCQPPGDWLDGAPWQHSSLTHCSIYLDESLNNPSVQVVVTLGSIPMRQILGLQGVDGVRVQDFHGTVHRDPGDRFWVVPTYHPSYLQRGASNLFDVVAKTDLAVARQLLHYGEIKRRPFQLFLDPPLEWFRQWVQGFLARLAHEGFAWLAVDIETPDKAGGRDEGELSSEDTSTQILRVNFASHGEEGITVPWAGQYIPLIETLLNSGAWLALWNKKYDESRLRFNSVKFKDPQGLDVVLIDGMWAAHHLQSDLPLGLGFWAPFYSNYGAWKHLGKQRGKDVEYAAVDGLQTYRIVPEGIVPALQAEGLWDAFWRHTHQREQYVLRPAYENGMPVDEKKLDQFHEKLQGVAAERLTAITNSGMAGNFYPKVGYAKAPQGKRCPTCAGLGLVRSEPYRGVPATLEDVQPLDVTCLTCQGAKCLPPVPPVGISGAKHREKGDHAKADYIDQGISLVARTINLGIRICQSCGKSGVGPSHDCVWKAAKKNGNAVDEPDNHAVITTETREVQRWFWQLPFNPDASNQILKFIKDSGEEPGKAKKTKKDTANKETLRKLHKKTGNPVYLHLLDYKAVKKVDSTYALGLKKRIWKSDGRIHPEITFRPSMFRDSCVNPNIQNVIADKDKKGSGSLAAGLRYCIVADPGYRLIEVDYSGTEAVDTGWYIGDPVAIRLATLGIHAYLTSHLLYEEKRISKPADLAWSDQDLAAFFSNVKKKFPEMYDKAKRCVHGNNYGLTTFGMAENFPDVFHSVKEAEKVQGLYYSLIPGLPAFHQRLRDVAYDTCQIGGSYVDDYASLVSGKFHPFGYRHKFYGVQTYRPLTESDYRKLQWIAKNKLKREKHPRVRMINGRPFEVVLGEDSKRVIAMYPQSNSAGKLKEAELALFHPESEDYIGDLADGKTPLVAPIHDSLLLHVPDRVHELVLSKVVEVMRRPSYQMPCPPEWGIGPYIRTNVAVKVSPVGGSWGDVEDVKIPDMMPETAMDGVYLPAEEDQYEDVQDLGTRMEMAPTLVS